MPKRFGFGLGFNISRFVGGGAPPTPSGFVARYLSSLGWSLVTGDNVEQWDDQSANNNDLTQATSGNQPTLFEYDVVKQSTLANMPNLMDTGGGVLAMEFESGVSQGLDGLDIGDEFTLEFDVNLREDSFNGLVSKDVSSEARAFLRSDSIWIYSDLNSTQSFDTDSNYFDQRITLILHKTGNSLSAYINSVQQGLTLDVTGRTYYFNILGRKRTSNGTDGSFYGYRQWNTPVADPTNITETPDFELIPEAQYMRNDSNATPSTGDSISAWLSTTHEPYTNEVRFTGNNKYMGGLSTQAGDFSYIFKGSVDVQAQDKRVFSNSGTGRSIGYDSSEVSYVEADDGTRYTFPEITNAGNEKVFIIVREGNTLRAYNGYTPTATTHDVTGKTFTYDRIGSNTLSMNGYKKEDTVYDYAVTDEQAKWWSYLRSTSGDILTPPLLPLPSYAVNSSTLNGTNQRYSGGNSFNYGANADPSFFFMFWVYIDSSGGSVQTIVNKYSSGGNRAYFLGYYNNDAEMQLTCRGTSSDVNLRFACNTDEWVHVYVEYDYNEQYMRAKVNNGAWSDEEVQPYGLRDSSADFEVGTYLNSSYLKGSIFQLDTGSTLLTEAQITEAYNGGENALCYASRTFNSSLDGSFLLGNYNGNTGQETEDLTGNVPNLTPINAPTYTDQGLVIECGS